MEFHSGGCLCGASRYRFSGAPRFSILCFCGDCQKATGGGHAPQLAVDTRGMSYLGPVRTWRSTSDRGNEVNLGFCRNCGSPLFKTSEMAPHLTFIFAGSLDEPDLFAEPRRVFEGSRLPWDTY
ncbi:hypothetical protein CLV78_101951 [Aliiruegeria haliotis]|uniref:CENP-V/GFA domain-containing protein n=1 Tax=Aliiruegeria haliotis TaxID=1280846 RepID=A0A2T0S087_9RHOB|nr:GFA family protein [Aliiruegeria haliotis]PRY26847.1 hypothetical protein CLV78_101951 [Aliiruegeria haliotis]